MKRRRLLSGLLTLVFLAALLFGLANVNAIADWYKLHNYTAPAEIAAIAGQDAMTASARRLFYVNHPELVDSVTTFRQDCPSNEQTIVLGCYQPGENGIFVYNVNDSRLAGIQQVTAAHEMLHAEYERLSSKDRQWVDSQLNAYYTNDLHDQRVINTINAYKKTEPNDVANEMHSVFGTEIANLPAPLENYYKRYFVNRSAVTDYAAGYEKEFTSLLNQIQADETTLTALKDKIDREEQNLNAEIAQINSDRSRLDSLRNSGQVDIYNSQVDSFNQEVDNYNANLARLQSDIAAYNNLVNAHNNIVAQLRSLNQAIDTRLTPQTTK